MTRVWSVDRRAAGRRAPRPARGVYDVGFGATSDRVVSAGDDGTVRIWDAGRTQSWTVPGQHARHRLQPRRPAHRDQQRRRRPCASGTPPPGGWSQPARTGRAIRRAKFSPAADDAADRSRRGAASVRVWPVAGRVRGGRRAAAGGAGSLSRELRRRRGERIVYVDDEGRLVVRDLASGREVTLGGGPEAPSTARSSAPTASASSRVPETRRVADLARRPPGPPGARARGPPRTVERARLQRRRPDRHRRQRTARSASGTRGGGSTVVMRGHEDEVTTAAFTTDGTQGR